MKLNIGENIRKFRKNMNLTQEQLAERLGVSVQSVSRWESGGGYPDMELLPELARVFDVSVDMLLGCREGNGESDVDELRKKLYAALYRETPSTKKIAALLRQLRMEYPQNVAQYASMLRNIPPSYWDDPTEILRELRLCYHVCVQHGDKDNAHLLVRTLARYEDEPGFRKLAVECCGVELAEPLCRITLRMDRAQAQGDLEKYIKLRQEKIGKDLCAFMHEWEMQQLPHRHDGVYVCDDLPSEVMVHALKISERKLQMLHTFRGTCASAKYPLSGDGAEDVWVPIEVNIGMRYAAQLSVMGQGERALTLLEEIAGLTEQSCAFDGIDPERDMSIDSQGCLDVPVRSQILPDLRGYKAHAFLDFVNYYINSETDRCGSIVGSVSVGNILRRLTGKKTVPTDTFRAQWLDTIRDHPRYKAVVERIEACRDRLIGQKENKV